MTHLYRQICNLATRPYIVKKIQVDNLSAYTRCVRYISNGLDDDPERYLMDTEPEDNMSNNSWRGHKGHGRGHPRHRGHSHGHGARNDYLDADEGNGYRGHSGRGRHRHGGQHHSHQDHSGGHHSHKDHSGRHHSGRGRSGRGRGHPDVLKGREIGLYYAKQSVAKREYAERHLVALDGRKEKQIERLLHSVRVADNINPQPSSSYASVENIDKEDSDISMASQPSGSGSVSRVASHLPVEEKMDVQETEDELEKPEMPNVNPILDIKEDERAFICKETVEGNSSLDQLYQRELKDKEKSKTYQSMMKFRKRLPSYDMVEDIVNTVNSNQVTVISGETGCGKTTQVPQFILDDYISKGMGSQCRIICTQPRRISAISVAERVAAERDEECGKENSVGYSIRLERQLPRKHGSILFCTTGILLKYLEFDPTLQHSTHIVLDEIHERDLLSDFMMIILKDILPVRPDLKIILMSATLKPEQFKAYFNNCPLLHIPGFTFPVTEYLLEDVIEMTGYMPKETNAKQDRDRYLKWKRRRKEEERDEQQWNLEAWSRNLDQRYSQRTVKALQTMQYDKVDCDLIVHLIRHISLKMEEGAILVFVPGRSDIVKIHNMLLEDKMFNSNNSIILPLHSMMPTVNQKQVFDTPPTGVRKIIIATNIAETSITIHDIVHVIDSGMIKVKDYIPELNLSTLDPQLVSKANARQRRGRAGRVKSGNCFHLYSSLQEMELRDFLPPEILRTALEELCLKIKILKLGKIKPFVDKAMEKPSVEALEKAIVNLQTLKALDNDENLLPLGYHLAQLPLDPHTGKMLLFGAMFGCLDPISTVAASLSFKNAFMTPVGKEKEVDRVKAELACDFKSDHIMLINAYDGWEKAVKRGTDRDYCYRYFLSSSTLKLLKNMKKQCAEYLCDIGFVTNNDPKHPAVNRNSNNVDIVKAVLCAGLYPNVAKVTNVPKSNSAAPKLKLKDQMKVTVHKASVNGSAKAFESKWMIYYQLMKLEGTTYAFDTTMVSPYSLLFFGGNITTEHDECTVTNYDYSGHTVIVDDWIKFWASEKTASLVNELREQLDEVLQSKITNPSPTNWFSNSKEGAVMRAIIELITAEEVKNKYGNPKSYR